MTTNQETRCGCRKHAITGLRCSKCDTPICPDCSRPAPVGMFCRACASNRSSPLYHLTPTIFAILFAVGLLLSILGGWIITSHDLPVGGIFGLVIGFVYGTAVGEILLRVSGRKRGLKIEMLGGFVVVVGVVVGKILNMHGADVDPESTFALAYLVTPQSIIMYCVCAYAAINRIRSI